MQSPYFLEQSEHFLLLLEVNQTPQYGLQATLKQCGHDITTLNLFTQLQENSLHEMLAVLEESMVAQEAVIFLVKHETDVQKVAWLTAVLRSTAEMMQRHAIKFSLIVLQNPKKQAVDTLVQQLVACFDQSGIAVSVQQGNTTSQGEEVAKCIISEVQHYMNQKGNTLEV